MSTPHLFHQHADIAVPLGVGFASPNTTDTIAGPLRRDCRRLICKPISPPPLPDKQTGITVARGCVPGEFLGTYHIPESFLKSYPFAEQHSFYLDVLYEFTLTFSFSFVSFPFRLPWYHIPSSFNRSKRPKQLQQWHQRQQEKS